MWLKKSGLSLESKIGYNTFPEECMLRFWCGAGA